MSGTLSNLHNLQDIVPCIIGLPHGNNVVATKDGSLILDGGISLENVLYVLGLTCNLISMLQFTEHSNCIILFT